MYLQKTSFFLHKKNKQNRISLKAISDKISLQVVVVVAVILSKQLQYIFKKSSKTTSDMFLFTYGYIFFLRKENIRN